MGQVLHGIARTTEAVRRAIQLRQESVRALARRFGVSPTTVQKWRKRTTTADAPMGPKEVRSSVLTAEEEAIIVACALAHAAAPRRLPLRSAADDPTSHAFSAAPLPSAPRHFPLARDRGRQAQEEALCLIPHRARPAIGPPDRPLWRPALHIDIAL